MPWSHQIPLPVSHAFAQWKRKSQSTYYSMYVPSEMFDFWQYILSFTLSAFATVYLRNIHTIDLRWPFVCWKCEFIHLLDFIPLSFSISIFSFTVSVQIQLWTNIIVKSTVVCLSSLYVTARSNANDEPIENWCERRKISTYSDDCVVFREQFFLFSFLVFFVLEIRVCVHSARYTHTFTYIFHTCRTEHGAYNSITIGFKRDTRPYSL